MVAGGIGQTPFLALGREAVGGRRYGDPPRPAPARGQVTLCYGVRTAELLAGVDDFREAGIDVRIASDDGSVGRHGLVTELLADTLDEIGAADCRVVCCGPEQMMEAVAELSHAARRALRGLAGDADGLRHRHLLQLRRQGAPGRRRVGLQAHLRRGAGLRRREDRVVSPTQSVPAAP